MRVSYQKSLDKFGYTEYLDKRGLTLKAQRAKSMHEQLEQIDEEIGLYLEKLNVKLLRNSSTVISNSYFPELETIIKNTFQMWKEVNYPFTEELLIRTSTFENLYGFSLPNKQITITMPDDTAKRLKDLLPELNSPDEILLHPRLNTESLKEKMIVARFKALPNKILVEFGYKGIEHINQLDSAENIFHASLDQKFSINAVKGDFSDFDKEVYEKLTLAAKLFIPFAEKIIVGPNDKEKIIVYEFQIIPVNGIMYMIFNDFEVL